MSIDNKELCCLECRVRLDADFSVRGREWKCPKCGRFTAYFDGYYIYLGVDERDEDEATDVEAGK